MENTTRMMSPEKDTLISQLKSQIFDLEQNEKNYNNLQIKYKSLSNENAILNEEKLRLEYELKQKTEASNKIIADLQMLGIKNERPRSLVLMTKTTCSLR